MTLIEIIPTNAPSPAPRLLMTGLSKAMLPDRLLIAAIFFVNISGSAPSPTPRLDMSGPIKAMTPNILAKAAARPTIPASAMPIALAVITSVLASLGLLSIH